MGKRKQQKLYQLNHKKQNPAKEQMKDILKQLAEMKKNNNSYSSSSAPLDMSIYKKKIKKDEKAQRYLKMKKRQSGQEQEEIIPVQAPKLNIFSVDTYDSGIKTIIVKKQQDKMRDQNGLEDQTNRLFGGYLNLDKFGEKPLKIIQDVQRVQLSDDQQQPNTLKNITHPNLAIPSGNYSIERSKQINEFRQKLPIFMKQQQIVETINNHLVTLICGQTGSGKSTQIGQFLVEKNYHLLGKIAITQPRRLAAIALANRVAEQMGTKLGDIVGFQVRHQRKDSPNSLIRYITDGILLNQMSSDYLLRNYSVIVVDQAHERKVNTDILIGLLSRLVLMRYKLSLQGKAAPLRLVIMSATMRIDDFKNTQLFNYFLPTINVQARMFPVTTFYEKETPEDYRSATVKKCLRIHRKLPPGDVLIFLTGKDEIHQVAVMLQQSLMRDDLQDSDQEQFQEIQQENPTLGYQIHCLYSSLPLPQQQKVFKAAPQNCRKFIISTNIAETSLTIPNIRYVIDSGQQKHRYHQGVWKWRKGWGSKAMAQQRAGRAGRTTHGYCYRLYSSALYANIMEEYPLPQICKLPLQSVLLQLKTIGIPDVFAFPFPTMPQVAKIKASLNTLCEIKAISGIVADATQNTQVTELGKVLSFLPLDPRLGKILLMGRKQGVIQHSLLLVILLTVQSIYLQDGMKIAPRRNQTEDSMKGKWLQEAKAKATSFRHKYKRFVPEGQLGDIFTCINILGQFFVKLFAEKGNILSRISRQSKVLQLNQNVMRQVYFNTDQIAQIYETLCGQKMVLNVYKQPSKQQVSALLDILLDAFIHNLSRFQEKNKYINKHHLPVYVHHLSDLYFAKSLFLSCTDFFSSQHGRSYMRYAFPVPNFQLLASYGQINPPSDFAWRQNKLVGLSKGTIFGWQIPNLFIQNVQNDIKYTYVARFLMEAKIFQSFKVFQKYLVAPTSTIRPDNLDYRVQKMVEVLRTRKIDSLEKMLQWWRKDKRFLKEEIKLWVSLKNFDDSYEKIRKAILAQHPQPK